MKIVHLLRGVEDYPDQRGPHLPGRRESTAMCGQHGPTIATTTQHFLVTCKKCRDDDGRRPPRIKRPTPSAPRLVKDSK